MMDSLSSNSRRNEESSVNVQIVSHSRMDSISGSSMFGSRSLSTTSFQFVVSTAFSALTVLFFIIVLTSHHIKILEAPLSIHPINKSEAHLRSAYTLHRNLDLSFDNNAKKFNRNLQRGDKERSVLQTHWTYRALFGAPKAPGSVLTKFVHQINLHRWQAHDELNHNHEIYFHRKPVSATELD